MTGTAATEFLRADHREIEKHLDPLLDALLHLSPARVDVVRRCFQEIRRLAGPHFAREESVFYPRLRAEHAGMLGQMDAEHEHTRLTERYLEELLVAWPETPEERDLTELHRLGIEFHDAVQTHIVHEEDYLLALADRVLPAEEQERLFRQMEKLAPVHPVL